MSNRIICLGDSNTEGEGDILNKGWPGRLAERIAAATPNVWSVCNLGVSGDTSLDIKHRLISEVIYREPGRLIIAAGVNDIFQLMIPDAIGPKIDIHFSRRIWREITVILKTLNVRTAFVSPLPVNEALLPLYYECDDGLYLGHMISNESIKSYNLMLADIVLSAGFEWIDVFTLWMGRPLDALLADGLHPNAQGYDLLTADIAASLDKTGFLE